MKTVHYTDYNLRDIQKQTVIRLQKDAFVKSFVVTRASQVDTFNGLLERCIVGHFAGESNSTKWCYLQKMPNKPYPCKVTMFSKRQEYDEFMKQLVSPT